MIRLNNVGMERIRQIQDKYRFKNNFCIDCGEVTRQKYKGVYTDGSHLYICTKCGCVNTEEAIKE